MLILPSIRVWREGSMFGWETRVSSSTLASAIIHDAYTSIKKIEKNIWLPITNCTYCPETFYRVRQNHLY